MNRKLFDAMPRLAAVWHWVGRFILYAGGLILGGGLLGALLHVAVGGFTHPHLDLVYLAAKGFLNGAFYLFIWAWSLSLVICVMQAYRAKSRASADRVPAAARDISGGNKTR